MCSFSTCITISKTLTIDIWKYMWQKEINQSITIKVLRHKHLLDSWETKMESRIESISFTICLDFTKSFQFDRNLFCSNLRIKISNSILGKSKWKDWFKIHHIQSHQNHQTLLQNLKGLNYLLKKVIGASLQYWTHNNKLLHF